MPMGILGGFSGRAWALTNLFGPFKDNGNLDGVELIGLKTQS